MIVRLNTITHTCFPYHEFYFLQLLLLFLTKTLSTTIIMSETFNDSDYDSAFESIELQEFMIDTTTEKMKNNSSRYHQGCQIPAPQPSSSEDSDDSIEYVS